MVSEIDTLEIETKIKGIFHLYFEKNKNTYFYGLTENKAYDVFLIEHLFDDLAKIGHYPFSHPDFLQLRTYFASIIESLPKDITDVVFPNKNSGDLYA